MRLPPKVTTAALSVGSIVLIAGCGGGGDGGGGGSDNTEGLAPAAILGESAEALAEAGPYRIGLEGTVLAGDLAPSSFLSGALGIDGEGVVVPPTGFSVDVGVDAGLPVEVNLTRVDDALYAGVLGRDLDLGLAPAQVAQLDPGSIITELPALVEDPVEAGREELDGVRVVRIEGVLTAERAQAALAPVLGAFGPAEDVAVEDGRVSILVGVDDLLPRRVRLAVGDVDADDGPAIDVAVDPSDFGADLTVTPPDDPQPLGAGGLGGLLGG